MLMLRSLFASLVLGIALTGCADQAGSSSGPVGVGTPSGPAVDPAGVSPRTLRDSTWRLVSIGGTPVARLHARLHLGSRRFQADTGVNAVSGRLAVRGDRLRLSGVSSTLVGTIGGPTSRWEGTQQDAFGHGELTFVVEGHTLTLRSAVPASPAVLVYRATGTGQAR